MSVMMRPLLALRPRALPNVLIVVLYPMNIVGLWSVCGLTVETLAQVQMALGPSVAVMRMGEDHALM